MLDVKFVTDGRRNTHGGQPPVLFRIEVWGALEIACTL